MFLFPHKHKSSTSSSPRPLHYGLEWILTSRRCLVTHFVNSWILYYHRSNLRSKKEKCFDRENIKFYWTKVLSNQLGNMTTSMVRWLFSCCKMITVITLRVTSRPLVFRAVHSPQSMIEGCGAERIGCPLSRTVCALRSNDTIVHARKLKERYYAMPAANR